MGMTLNEWNGFGKPYMKISYITDYPRNKFILGSLDGILMTYHNYILYILYNIFINMTVL